MSRIAIVVQMQAKPGQFDAYLAKMTDHARASRAEPGCLRFDVVVPNKGENTLFLYELWQDQAALDVHANTERIKAHRAGTRDMVAESTLNICTVHDSGDV